MMTALNEMEEITCQSYLFAHLFHDIKCVEKVVHYAFIVHSPQHNDLQLNSRSGRTQI